jgi:dipeptidyl aminopeptidase/acylaminoacyl peptidase
VRWFGDGTRIALLAAVDSAGSNQNQVYVIDTKTKQATRRTNSATRIFSYSISNDAATIVYAAQVAADTAAQYIERVNGVVALAGQPGFLFDSDRPFDSNIAVFVESDGRAPRRQFVTRRAIIDYFERSGFVEISPDGRSAILGMHLLDSVPPRWQGYKSETIRDFIDSREIAPPTYGLIDLQTGQVSLLIDAPSVWGGTTAAWSADGKTIFATGFLPLDSANQTAMRLSASGGGIIEIDAASRKSRLVIDGIWRIARVASRGDTVTVIRALGYPANLDSAARRGVSARTLVRDRDSWRMIDSTDFATALFNSGSAVVANDQVVVGINETVDHAPQLTSYDRRSKGTRAVTSLNPTLSDLPRGAIRRVKWTSSRGDEWEAHLVTPVGYVKGRRYPAVIMVMDMGYNDQYVLDGRFYKAAYPVQALANRGIAVLMTYFPRVFTQNYVKPVEREIILTGTDGAFEYLVREGLADSAKIGITGFSHSGYVVQYALTQSRHRYGAAVAIDNFDGGYVNYIVFNHVTNMNGIDEFYGGHPFGPAMSTWQREAPAFASARVRTPLLLEPHGSNRLGRTPTSVVSGWETFTALRRLGKPVELVRYTYGLHILEKPLERYSSMHRQVDWLTFWLKGEMDPAPSKRDQYQRWTAMR